MGWCITDPQMSPPELRDQWFTEKLLRLKESYWCYRAPPASPPVGPLPAERSGYITFGSLNSFAKVNPQVIALWALVLEAVPNSKLLVHAPMGDANATARKMFTDAGIDPQRLMLIGRAAGASNIWTCSIKSTLLWILFPTGAAQRASMRSGWACRWLRLPERPPFRERA